MRDLRGVSCNFWFVSNLANMIRDGQALIIFKNLCTINSRNGIGTFMKILPKPYESFTNDIIYTCTYMYVYIIYTVIQMRSNNVDQHIGNYKIFSTFNLLRLNFLSWNIFSTSSIFKYNPGKTNNKFITYQWFPSSDIPIKSRRGRIIAYEFGHSLRSTINCQAQLV